MIQTQRLFIIIFSSTHKHASFNKWMFCVYIKGRQHDMCMNNVEGCPTFKLIQFIFIFLNRQLWYMYEYGVPIYPLCVVNPFVFVYKLCKVFGDNFFFHFYTVSIYHIHIILGLKNLDTQTISVHFICRYILYGIHMWKFTVEIYIQENKKK